MIEAGYKELITSVTDILHERKELKGDSDLRYCERALEV